MFVTVRPGPAEATLNMYVTIAMSHLKVMKVHLLPRIFSAYEQLHLA